MSAGAVPDQLRYTESHEWLRAEGGEIVVGITDHAQQELTDIVFVDLPKVGTATKAGGSALVLESVKTVADVYAPADGEIVAVNAALKGQPELVNRSPYGDGWLFRIRPAPGGAASPTLSASDYARLAASGTA